MPDAPNVLVFMCDQLTARVLGTYGGMVPTPNLDRLAREGTRFDAAICTTPICSPSRASFVTGLYPHAHGIIHNAMRVDYPTETSPETEETLSPDDVTTESLLNAAGYETHHLGKWHLSGEPLPYFPDMYREHIEYASEMRSDFDRVRQTPRDTWLDWYGWALPVRVSPELRRAVHALGGKWDGNRHAEFLTKMGRLDLPLDQIFDVRTVDRTVECIRAPRSGPFLVTCSMNYPHDPNVVPAPYDTRFEPSDDLVPENHEAMEPRFEREWSHAVVRDLGAVGLREFLRLYYGAVRLIDDQLGRVLDALDDAGLRDNTVVVFVADHGDMAGSHRMVWKSTSAFYEDVSRVPLIVSAPGGRRGAVVATPVSLVDIHPTLLELTGAGSPSGSHGVSLAGVVLEGAEKPGAPFAFCERMQPHSERRRAVEPGRRGAWMVRAQDAKLVVYPDGEEMMYDLANDSGENRNVAQEPTYAARKRELHDALREWHASTDYPSA